MSYFRVLHDKSAGYIYYQRCLTQDSCVVALIRYRARVFWYSGTDTPDYHTRAWIADRRANQCQMIIVSRNSTPILIHFCAILPGYYTAISTIYGRCPLCWYKYRLHYRVICEMHHIKYYATLPIRDNI